MTDFLTCPHCGLVKVNNFVFQNPENPEENIMILHCNNCGFTERAKSSSVENALRKISEQKKEEPKPEPQKPMLNLLLNGKEKISVTLEELEKKGISVRPESEQNPKCNLKEGHMCGFHTDSGIGICLKPIIEDHKLKGFKVRTCSKFKKRMEKLKVEG